MSKNIDNNKRMARNTLLMYLRMLVLIIVQLYTVPIVLHALGVEDYGIFNVVGGFVALFTFVNGALISGCQRFMAYAIGKRDYNQLKEAFDTSIFIFVVLGVSLFVVIEGVGIWFLNNKMTIPADRVIAANVVFQFSLLSLFVTILSTPFNAVVIAHERMSIYAYASIFESVYKLVIAFSLTIVLMDKLIIFALLSFTSSLLLAIFYIYYCRRFFIETKSLSLRRNKNLLKDIGSYASWNVIGSLALILRNHGLNVVMNLFFSPLMNAAHTIASHLSGLFNQFVSNIYMATRPQMVKKYAEGDIPEMWNITFKSSKYAFFMMVFAVIPVGIELPLFLKLWLRDYPDYTVAFSRLIIFSLLLETMTNQLIGAFQAANKIKFYQTVSSIILLSVVPFSYIGLTVSNNPIIPYVIYVIISLVYILSLMFVAQRQIDLNIKAYIANVIWKDVVVFVPSFLITLFVVRYLPVNYWRIPVTFVISFIISSLLVWYVGINERERIVAKHIIKKQLKKHHL